MDDASDAADVQCSNATLSALLWDAGKDVVTLHKPGLTPREGDLLLLLLPLPSLAL